CNHQLSCVPGSGDGKGCRWGGCHRDRGSFFRDPAAPLHGAGVSGIYRGLCVRPFSYRSRILEKFQLTFVSNRLTFLQSLPFLDFLLLFTPCQVWAPADPWDSMYTGWHQIDGKWYYFNTEDGAKQGMMLKNTVTQDGYPVNEQGVWIQ
ncbi:MAG: hypothetical protein HP059_12430, partial [Clostridium sp.]|nr:hypothetical protein [Clostridium sp.]